MFSFLKKKEVEKNLKAILTGKTVPIEEVPDKTFATKILGDGVAFEPKNDDTICAPGEGVIISASEDMKHACGIKLSNGIEVLLHIGIDTVSMNGEGFTLLVKEGDKVSAGTPLIRFDIEKIKAAGFPATTMLIVTDSGDAKNIEFQTGIQTIKGETVIAEF